MSDIQQIELTIEQNKKAIKVRDALKRLRENSDFKLVFEDELFDTHARNLVYLLASPNADEKMQADIIEEMKMIGNLRQFFSAIYAKGNMADKSKIESEEALDEMLNEEVA